MILLIGIKSELNMNCFNLYENVCLDNCAKRFIKLFFQDSIKDSVELKPESVFDY